MLKGELHSLLNTNVRLKAAKRRLERHRFVRLIVDQPQIQLVELGTEEQVHILRAEGRRVLRAPSSGPRSGSTRLSDASHRLLWLSDLTDFRELQETLQALLTKRRDGTVLAACRHLKYGLQPAERRVRDSGQTQEVGADVSGRSPARLSP